MLQTARKIVYEANPSVFGQEVRLKRRMEVLKNPHVVRRKFRVRSLSRGVGDR